MYSCVLSGAVIGLQVRIVHVEVDISYGMPCFDMSGVLATEVKESRERVQVAIRNAGIVIKPSKIAVNISPANVRKQGTGFDVPIAVGILAAAGMIPMKGLEGIFIMGELSLSGRVNGVRGILPALCEARASGIRRCIIPKDNMDETAPIEGMEIYAAETLSQVIDCLKDTGCFNGKSAPGETGVQGRSGGTDVQGALFHKAEHDKNRALGIAQVSSSNISSSDISCGDRGSLDYSSIKGQELAKRATLVAAAGMHNLLYVGSPGCGKTMMAQRIPSIMPSMTFEEQLEISKIYSISGLLTAQGGWMKNRPFRNPHHTITARALMGGGLVPAAGEITLAHGGVLFLDELTEFSMKTLEHLRQPLEDRQVNISRVHGTYTFPADFMLVAAMNPCKCGYFPDRNRCRCTEHDLERYIGRISKPMWDRFDIVVKTEEVTIEDIMERNNPLETVKRGHSFDSASMKRSVEEAVAIQKERFHHRKFAFNAMMSIEEIKEHCVLGAPESELLGEVYHKMALTVRGYYKVLKVARTIADLEGAQRINTNHISEAVSYRSDRVSGGGI